MDDNELYKDLVNYFREKYSNKLTYYLCNYLYDDEICGRTFMNSPNKMSIVKKLL